MMTAMVSRRVLCREKSGQDGSERVDGVMVQLNDPPWQGEASGLSPHPRAHIFPSCNELPDTSMKCNSLAFLRPPRFLHMQLWYAPFGTVLPYLRGF